MNHKEVKFKDVSARQIHKLAYAICNLDARYDYGDVLLKLFDEYLER